MRGVVCAVAIEEEYEIIKLELKTEGKVLAFPMYLLYPDQKVQIGVLAH